MDLDPRRLEGMLNEGRLEELLSLVSLEEIADAWWRYTLRDRSEGDDASDDPDWWAIDLWLGHSGIYKRGDMGREGIRLLAERAPEGADLGYLGAGPIENFLQDDEDQLR